MSGKMKLQAVCFIFVPKKGIKFTTIQEFSDLLEVGRLEYKELMTGSSFVSSRHLNDTCQTTLTPV